jgi:hypothetical protein
MANRNIDEAGGERRYRVGCLKRGLRDGLDELIQHDGCDQSGGADEAKQLQQSEGFTGCGGDLLRSHGVFLKIGKSEMVHGSKAGASRLAQT